VGTASDADSHDDSIAVEGDKLVIRQQSLPVAAPAPAAVSDQLSSNDRYYYINKWNVLNCSTNTKKCAQRNKMIESLKLCEILSYL